MLGGGFGLPKFAAEIHDGAGDIFDAVAPAVFQEPFATAGENAASQLAVPAGPAGLFF